MKSNSYDRRAAAGGSWVGNLIWFALAVLTIFASIRFVNPKLHEYALEKKIEEICRFGGVSRKPELIQKDVFDYAQVEKIPVKMEDIVVSKPGSTVIVHVTYEEPIDFIIMKFPYKVDIEKSSTSF